MRGERAPERAVPEGRRHAREADRAAVTEALLVVVLLGIVTVLHLFTPVSDVFEPWHGLYRRLYYIPIIYAGFSFGRRGGLITALAASVLYGTHASIALDGLVGPGTDNLYEIAMYVTIGILFGWMRDLETSNTASLRVLSGQLEHAYRTLEERAIQLANIQDYTQSILRSITAGVMTVGPDGSVVTVNPAVERMFGSREADMVPRRLKALLADDGGIEEDITKVLSGRVPRTVRDTRIITKGGRVLHVQVTTSRMRDVDGRIIGAVVTLEDVSEVKALTDQLIRADRLAAMGELTAGVAHEVRNPLGIIRASVQLLEEPGADRETVREATTVIKQEIDRLDKVIKALLDFGRPNRPHMQQVDLSDVIDDVVLFTRRFAKQSNVRIERSIPETLPPVRADADQLKQVFVNLISNAVQAMQPIGGLITVSAREDEGFVSVTVADTGPGIPAARLPKIFDPFYSTRSDGTGLGLTMVHRIIDEHDGHIEVASNVGEGTSFTVSLPIADEVREMRER